MALLVACQKERNIQKDLIVSSEKKTSSDLFRASSSVSLVSSEIIIGTQVWTNQNLTVSRYRNGDIIPQVTDYKKWVGLSTGAWCWYNNDSATYWPYGKLYNWYAVNDPRGLAPIGWHIPSDVEWSAMVNFLGGASVAGGALKEAGTIHWNSPNTGATNSTGFTGLPGGYRYASGPFNFNGVDGYWWTSTSRNTSSAWYHNLYYTDATVYRFTSPKNYGFSVRVIKN